MGNCSASCLAAGGPSSGLLSHAHKSLKMNSYWRSSAGQIGKRPAEAGFHLQVLQDQHGDEHRPDLRLDRIGAGAQERLYFRCLFQGFKQQGNIMPINIDRLKSRSTTGFISYSHTRCL
jgi:hypothetical protein